MLSSRAVRDRRAALARALAIVAGFVIAARATAAGAADTNAAPGAVAPADKADRAVGRTPAATTRTIVILGDSLSAEYGLARDTGWAMLLVARLVETRLQYNVLNASISGETTSGGRSRLPGLLARYRPAVVVLELGANDGLRGLPLAQMRANLQAMIDASRAAGARVLLVGMRIPPNYGRVYADGFGAVYVELAHANRVALVPFLFEGFADRLELFQADHLHPVAAAEPLMLANVWPPLKAMLEPRG